MKIIKYSTLSSRDQTLSLSEAIEDKLQPNPYYYDGQLEKLQGHIDLQSEVIKKLIVLLSTKVVFNSSEIEDLLGYGYTVEE